MSKNLLWQRRLAELDSLTKNNGTCAWKTAKIVKQLLADKSFMASNGGEGKAEKRLAKYAGRFALGLNDMVQMVSHFPHEKDWADGRLDILRDKTATALQRKKSKTKKPSVARDRPEWKKMYAELEEKHRKLQLAHDKLQASHAELKVAYDSLAKILGKRAA